MRTRLSAVRSLVTVAITLALALVCTSCAQDAVAAPSKVGDVAYVANGSGLADPGNTLAVVNTENGHVLPAVMTGTREATTASLPSALAATPDGREVLVADKGVDVLSVIDTASGKETGRVRVGLEPDAVAVTPDGSLALVANLLDATVTPVDLTSLRAGAAIHVGREPDAVAVAPDGSLALVANFEDGTVTPIALPSLQPGPPIPVGLEPDAIAVNSDGSVALVADLQTSTVVPIALPSLHVGSGIPVAGDPTGIAITPGGTAYVSGGDDVTPISVSTLDPGPPIPLGAGSEAIVLGPHGTDAWVCTRGGDLVGLDLATDRVLRRVVVGGEPVAAVIPAPRAPRPR